MYKTSVCALCVITDTRVSFSVQVVFYKTCIHRTEQIEETFILFFSFRLYFCKLKQQDWISYLIQLLIIFIVSLSLSFYSLHIHSQTVVYSTGSKTSAYRRVVLRHTLTRCDARGAAVTVM